MGYKLKKNEQIALDFIVNETVNNSETYTTTTNNIAKDLFRQNIEEDAVKIVVDNYDVIKKIIDEDDVLSNSFSILNQLNNEKEILGQTIDGFTIKHEELFKHGFKDNSGIMSDVLGKTTTYLSEAKKYKTKMTQLYDVIIRDLDDDQKIAFSNMYDHVSLEPGGGRRGVENPFAFFNPTTWDIFDRRYIDAPQLPGSIDLNLEGPFINPYTNELQYSKLPGVNTKDFFNPEGVATGGRAPGIGHDDIFWDTFYEGLDDYQKQYVNDFMKMYGHWQKNVGLYNHIDQVILGGYSGTGTFDTRELLKDEKGNPELYHEVNLKKLDSPLKALDALSSIGIGGGYGYGKLWDIQTNPIMDQKTLDDPEQQVYQTQSGSGPGGFPLMLLKPSERDKYNQLRRELDGVNNRIKELKDYTQTHLNELDIEGSEGGIIPIGLLYSFDEFDEKLQESYKKTRDWFMQNGIDPKLVDLYWKNIKAGNLSDIAE